MKKEYGLIGNPLVHSFSQKYFTEKFSSQGIDAQYFNFELDDIGDIMELISEHENLQGFNITIPYKELIIPYLDQQSEEVQRIGAANVVKIIRQGGNNFSFYGYNTDYTAFKRSIEFVKPKNFNALVLGTGGASKAVEAALIDLGYKVVKVSRTPDKDKLGYDNLSNVINDFFLIVNCTPLGTFPSIDTCPDIPYDLLSANHLCYDLVYNPGITEFMKRAAIKGAAVKNGYEMLISQAELSWEIWNK